MLCDWLLRGAASANLMKAALTHDMAEQFTGDIPAPAKWASDELQDALHKLEEKFEIYEEMPSYPITKHEMEVLKAADMLDLVLKCAEEMMMGNDTVKPMVATGLLYLRENCNIEIPILFRFEEEMVHVGK
jgi:5'-deoxynucleotidase YfbR-like HD superfamily hydrolase